MSKSGLSISSRSNQCEEAIAAIQRTHDVDRLRSHAGCGGLGSADEVGFVNHSAGLPSGDADEDALVQPLQVGGGGLDLG